MYYNECPYCGAHLDPCEPCDCRDEKELRLRKRQATEIRITEMLEEDERWNQEKLRICC